MNNFCIKHCGMINAMGASVAEVLDAYLSDASAGMGLKSGYLPHADAMLGEVTAPLADIPTKLSAYSSRNNRLLLTAYKQIEADVEALIEKFGKQRIAIVLGTSTSGIAEGEAAYLAFQEQGGFSEGYAFEQQDIASPSEFLKAYLGLSGIAYTISTACSSSAKAFASAQQLLASNLADVVLVGGADALCKLTVNGFTALEATSSEACKPFSRDRQGINIGEAAALMVLTKDAGGIQLKGVGVSSDAHHISAPEPEGEGAVKAMQVALERAGLAANEIFYLNLHGTATKHNDDMEAKAFNKLFTAATHTSSTKPLTGHTLGAAGATEIALCWALLSVSTEKKLKLRPQLNVMPVDANAKPVGLLQESIMLPQSGALYMQSNSFAFGGSNCSVVLGRE